MMKDSNSHWFQWVMSKREFDVFSLQKLGVVQPLHTAPRPSPNFKCQPGEAPEWAGEVEDVFPRVSEILEGISNIYPSHWLIIRNEYGCMTNLVDVDPVVRFRDEIYAKLNLYKVIDSYEDSRKYLLMVFDDRQGAMYFAQNDLKFSFGFAGKPWRWKKIRRYFRAV